MNDISAPIAANDAFDIPEPIYRPPFNVTRASHAVMQVSDLGASRDFYTGVIGLVVSDADADAVYLRGMEEACHHSLVLKKASGAPVAECVGMRVLTEDDLDELVAHYKQAGLPAEFIEAPYQGRTVRTQDPVGTRVEFCASMETRPRLLTAFDRYTGGSALRLDHYQIHSPNPLTACRFYMSFGFRLSEYMVRPDGELLGVFLQRKGNPHDIVFFDGPGPRLHHFAYNCGESQNLFRACDIAGQMGFGKNIEFGPGRHGPAFGLFTYFRDPDGHRVELFNAHYQTIDIDDKPVRWQIGDEKSYRVWGFPPQKSWYEEASGFDGVEIVKPEHNHQAFTLQRYLELNA
jgi:catechol 2,3-dioxygenase